jgi:hypothetical protein
VSLYHNRISPLFYIFLLTYLFIYMLWYNGLTLL